MAPLVTLRTLAKQVPPDAETAFRDLERGVNTLHGSTLELRAAQDKLAPLETVTSHADRIDSLEQLTALLMSQVNKLLNP